MGGRLWDNPPHSSVARDLKEVGQARIRRRPQLKRRTRLIREWQGRTYEVAVRDDGFSWQGAHYRSPPGSIVTRSE
jgi:hypothetical protein